ncbi:SAV_2336 N-terminal domain-related protein [Streptomyces sp. NPDC046853]|uniref:SAV_2336 N-terminal domain-related protein n=1 Tax=Streptomyces sp. NPDC046853 TaxID=3154920 RepID=UPI0033E4F5E5
MRPDPPTTPRHRGLVARLADVLAEAAGGARPASIELAELLWLAGQAGGGASAGQEEAAEAPPLPTSSPVRPTPPVPGPVAPAPPPPRDDRVPLRLPGRPDASAPHASAEAPPTAPGPTPGHTPVRVPVPPMVTHPLTLQRALRPLKRRVPSPVGQVIDEEATAHRIARLGGHPQGWLPVLRPADERWLRLCLVYDAGPTMPIWRPLVHELHTALAQSGIFRTVELHRAQPDGTVPPQVAHAPATGRTVTLVISDCMGPQWRTGAAGDRWYRTLRRWAGRMPTAVIQPLPERLWRTTALPTTPGTLRAPHPAAPSAALTFTPYAADAPPPAGAVPVPVLEPAGTWLSHWAELVADAGGSQLPGAVGWLGPAPANAASGGEDVTRLSAEDLVLRFRSTASPEAFRLAGHLAVGVPRLPVMRLVQAAVEERPRPQHLAEVILSGMLASDGGAGSYEFRDGVRELLLRSLPRTARGRTRELLARVGGLIDERAGTAPGELGAVAASGTGAGPKTPLGEPFATVTPESARQLGVGRDTGLLGDRYRMVRQIGHSGRMWLAEDQRHEGAPVVVQRYPQAPQWLRLDFTRVARQLSRFRHPQVAAVQDYANGEVPYLVMDFADGPSLRDLLAEHPDGLPAHRLLELVPPLAAAVSALHTVGLAHGGLSASYVRLPATGPVLCGFALVPHNEGTRAADLSALGRLVRAMYGGGAMAAEQEQPRAPRTLPRAKLRSTLRSAVDDLDSADLELQRQGLQRLTQLAALTPVERVYSLFGPLRVTQNGRPLATGAPREQAMLCMLLQRRGRGVSHDELIEGMWGSGAPPDARRLLGTYASRLRNALGPDSVVTERDAYVLPLPTGPDVVDLFHAQRLSSDAQHARFSGDFTRARELVQSALDLWRGTPLADVPGPAALATRATIAELRQSLLRMWGELDREQGLAVRSDDELAELLREFPYTEDEVLAPHEELPGEQLDDLGVSRELPDDQPTPPGTTLTFEDLTHPSGPRPETLHRLGREISHLLITGGIGPDHFELLPRPHGWDVTVAPEVHVLHVLTASLHQLPEVFEQLPDIGLGVTVTHEPDPTVAPLTFPAELRHVFDRPRSRAVVIVSNNLHDRLRRSGRMGDARFEPVPQSDDWYCEVTAPAEPRPAGTAASAALSALLAGRTAVILGFDGPVVPLYTDSQARGGVLHLMRPVLEAGGIADTLDGSPLLADELSGYEGRMHPMDLLRAHQSHELAAELRTRLTYIERQNLMNARPTPHLPQLLDALADRGIAVAVAGDCDSGVMAELLIRRDLAPAVPGGAHGRSGGSPLLPDPDCLRRALLALDSDAEHCVLVGSSSAELLAARQLELPFIGFRRDESSYRRLRAEGCELTLDSLAPLTGTFHGT